MSALLLMSLVSLFLRSAPEEVSSCSCKTPENPPQTTGIPENQELVAGRFDEVKDNLRGPKLVFIEGGKFRMGSDKETASLVDGEKPSRKVLLSDFWIDETEVSNRYFLQFISETNYTTDAEKHGWSFVFEPLIHPLDKLAESRVVSGRTWWIQSFGASWKHPFGASSSIFSTQTCSIPTFPENEILCEGKTNEEAQENLLDFPVVHVSWNDAFEFCKWAQKRLPTEAEFEYAARGNLKNKDFWWGDQDPDEVKPDQQPVNIWQGDFPLNNTKVDGYLDAAPVSSFQPNPFGLYHILGNVWELVFDFFERPKKSQDIKKDTFLVDPKGPNTSTKGDRVMKGGSFMCHWTYCHRYKVYSRLSNRPDSSSSNTGFRCALSN
eukprot:TRINITY_DN3334_c0_g1_i1.p1 TRINITY_DN3334_c0_g1~~TRINITY_DN3334_c0_g1_i1.p1  ORF type:complete len:389 (-),score=58.60 TRINITY_DN3334_c0_g1_i1:269-1405(-)